MSDTQKENGSSTKSKPRRSLKNWITRKEELCELLFDIASDSKAPPTARCAAARALLDEMRNVGDRSEAAPATEMSVDELDAAIAAFERKA